MVSFALLALGMAIVVGGILVLRLHAFLALTLAALAVALLTPRQQVLGNEMSTLAVKIGNLQGEGATAEVALDPRQKQGIVPGRGKVYHRVTANTGDRFTEEGKQAPAVGDWIEVGEATISPESREGLRRIDTAADVRPGDFFLHHTQLAAAGKTSGSLFAERVAFGFGDTCRKIGILIAMASVIGFCLTQSGAAERIVHTLVGWFGIKRAPLSFVGSGFLLGIPVFFDTVFYLMMPLGKALGRRMGGKNYLLIVLSIVAGGTMAHSLVPPTPGPLFVADALGISFGTAVAGGLAVGVFTVTSGYLFATFLNRRMEVPMRTIEGETEAEIPTEEELKARVDQLPGFLFSILPILLPVVLLAGTTIADSLVKNGVVGSDSPLLPVLKALGNKNIALVLGALVGLLLVWSSKPARGIEMGPFLGKAISSAGVIILITSAGGAFGHVLRQTGIAGATQDLLPEATSGVMLLVVAFFLCTLIRTAQGSATVAMITTVGIIAPIALAAPLPYHPVYLALAIGCGSKPISWMNDSGFWVISKMSGLTEGEMLRTNTLMGCVMATVGLVVCVIGALVLPLA